MSSWNEARARASELGVYKVGMKRQDVDAAIAAAEGINTIDVADLSVGRGRPDERAEQEGFRGERVPMGGFRQQLSGGYQRPGFYYRWITDVDDRIQRAQQAGFVEPSEEDDDYEPRRTVNKRSSTPQKGVKMRQKMSYHLEDEAFKARQIDLNEEGIYNHEQGPEGAKTPEGVTYGETNINNQFKR